MSVQPIYYIAESGEWGLRYYKPFTPTGRWAVRTDPAWNEAKLFMEHWGLIFNRWVCEDELELRLPASRTTNRCY